MSHHGGMLLASALGLCFALPAPGGPPAMAEYDIVYEPAPAVKTSFGTLEGVSKNGAHSFLGVPYAAPPVGALRFADPQPWNTPYKGARAAKKLAATCLSNGQPKGDEDCLYLNVHVPATATPAANLPVLLFIHGGSFVFGSGNDYDCSDLAAAHNAVYVTINYRLGAFGWLQATEGSGNFGFKDQRTAMRYVKNEIAAFGGNPEHIMIFGESAGAISVQNHVVANMDGGLFTHALSESGMPSAGAQVFALNNTAKYAQAAGCTMSSDLSCLRAQSTKQLLAAAEKVSPASGNPFIVPGWGPTVDGVVFTADPNTMLKQGMMQRNVTVIAGSNTNEGNLFTPAGPMDKKAYEAYITAVLYGHGKPFNQSQFDQVLEMYPETDPKANYKSAAALSGDITFVCGSRYMVKMAHTYSDKPSRLYHFDIPTSGLVLHASELPYVFGYTAGMDAAKKKVAGAMQSLWYSFAEGSGPADLWPVYTNATDVNIVFRSPMKGQAFGTETGRRKKYCDFWERLMEG